MYRGSKTKRIKQVGASLAIATGLFAGGVGIASAATGTHAANTSVRSHANVQPRLQDHFRGGPEGRHPAELVSAVSATSLTVSRGDSTTETWQLTSSTVVLKGHATASLSDLAVGERVDVRPTAPGSAVAAAVMISVPHLAGQVVSVSGNTVVVSDADGFYRTLNVTNSTTYVKGSTAASFSDITTGTFVAAEGSVNSDHTSLDATSVGIGLPPLHDGPPPMGH